MVITTSPPTNIPATPFGDDDSFTYRASDGIAESDLATVTITYVRPPVDLIPPPPPPTTFLQGIAFVDNNRDGKYDDSDTPEAGATIQLFATSGEWIGEQFTNADGYYRFDHVPLGSYLLQIGPSSGLVPTGVQIRPLFNAGDPTVTEDGPAIAVTVSRIPDFAGGESPRLDVRVLDHLLGADAGFTLDGGPLNSGTESGAAIGQFLLELSGIALPAPRTIHALSTDLLHANPTTYTLNAALAPMAPTSTDNVGRIGYLYNHFGIDPLSPAAAAGLQLAIWELLYDDSPDLAGGDFQVAAPGPGSPTDPAAYAAAQAFMDRSAGKAEWVYFLNDRLSPDELPDVSNTQGMIATEGFNFAGLRLWSNAGLTVRAASDGEIIVSWTDVSGWAGFRVERSADGRTWTPVGTTGAGVASFLDTGLQESTRYAYRVLAFRDDGGAAYSSVRDTFTLPAAPIGLSVTSVSTTRNDLTWTDRSSAESGYTIERSLSANGPWTQVGTTDAGVTTYSDTDLIEGTSSYSYRVRAYNDVGSSAPASATIAGRPSTPRDLTATAVSPTQIDLSWSPASGATSYVIERSPSGSSSWVQIGTTGADVTTYSDTALTEGTSYSYRVRASNDAGASESSTTSSYYTPTIVTPASANPGSVTDKTASLRALGAVPSGESNLRYTWSVVAKPNGASSPAFSANGTNAAKDVTATFAMAGIYTFRVTITNGNQSVTSAVSVTVEQTLTSIAVTSANATVQLDETRQFTATAKDQFGRDMETQPSVTWSLASGDLGQISSSGLYTAPGSGSGTVTVLATTDGITGTVSVDVGDRVVIGFNDLAVGTVVTDQYAFARFSADPGKTNKVIAQTLNSHGNLLSTDPPNPSPQNWNNNLYVDFNLPVNGLKFTMIGAHQTGVVAQVRVFEHGTYAATASLIGLGNVYTPAPQDLTRFRGVTRIEIVNITDIYGLWWDDFSFGPAPPDLDIDSDNNNGFDPNFPRSSQDNAEDQIEDDDAKPGKILVVNTDDTDGDGIPDFADGFDRDGSPGADDQTSGEQFIPLVLELPQGIDPSQVRLQFDYSGSDPAGVTTTTSESGTVYTPADGHLRLWIKDGGQARGKSGLADGGDYITPDHVFDASALGLGGGNRKVTLWLEAIRPSTDLGDGRIKVSLDPDGSGPIGFIVSDAVRVTTFRTRFVQVAEGGGLSPVENVEVSHPTPVFSNVSVSIVPGSLRTNADKTKILGDIRVSGDLDDAASDLIAGDAGKIGSVQAFLNGADTLLATITTSVTKGQGGSSLLKPYDFSATFSTTLTGVELNPGWNLFHLSATNAYGLSGFAEVSAEVVVTPPPDGATDIRLELQGDPYTDSTAGILASFRRDGGSWSAPVLLRRQGAFDEHRFGGGNVVVDFDGMAPFDPLKPDERTAAVTNPALDLGGEVVRLRETSNNGGVLEGVHLSEEFDRVDYTDYTFRVGAVSDVTASGAGDFNPFLIEVQGPSGLRDLVSDASIANQTYDVVAYEGGHYLALPNTGSPRPFLLAQAPALATPPQQDAEKRDGTWNYVQGLGTGLLDTGIDLWDGVTSLARGAWHVARNYNPFTVGYRLVVGQDIVTVEDQQRLYAVWDTAEALWGVADHIMKDDHDFVLAILTGDNEELNRLGEKYSLAFEYAVEILQAINEVVVQGFVNLDDFTLGRIVGRVLGETVLAIATAGIGTALKSATMPGVIAKLKNVSYIGRFAPLVTKLDEVAEFMKALSTTKMCFAAGTKVHTAEGLKDIETIRPGDLVLSSDEQTGELAHKPVRETVVTHPTRLYHVHYRTGASATAELVGTAEHPFYVTNRSAFVPAGDLRVGDELVLAGGGAAHVTAIDAEDVADGTFTTYNFEVADFHTYFVGDAGVWVHNAGTLCEKAFSIWHRHRTKLGESPEFAFKTIETVLTKYMTSRTFSNNQQVKHLGDVLDSIVKEVRKAAGKYVPSGDIWSPGPASVNSSGINLWKRHWLKHKGEFPEFTSPIHYVDSAMDFTGQTVSNVATGGARRVVEGTKGGRTVRIVWDRNGGKNDFGVATVNPDGSLGPISTYFRLDRVKLEGPDYHLRDIPGGPDVFEQYFNGSVSDLINPVLR